MKNLHVSHDGHLTIGPCLCCDPRSGALEEMVNAKQTLLKEKELQSRHLEEQEQELQQEVHLLYVLDYLCTTLSKEDI